MRHNSSAPAPALWAELAAQYDGKDRWYLEALGIGAQGNEDACFKAWKKKVGKDWDLSFRGNFTWNRAININDANAPWPYPWQQRIGRKIGQRFGFTDLGLFTDDKDVANSPYQTGTNKAGDVKYKDLNGDGKIDTYDQGPIGYGSIPEIVYGFGPTVNYKGFALAAWFKGISNVDIALNELFDC